MPPQARLSASANALQQPPALQHYAAAGPQPGLATPQRTASDLRQRVASLEAQLAAAQQHSGRQRVRSPQQIAEGRVTVGAGGAAEDDTQQMAAELADSHRQLAATRVCHQKHVSTPASQFNVSSCTTARFPDVQA